MKITVIGNSVALRVRPPQNHPDNKNYTALLRDHYGTNSEVESKALGATTITNWLNMSDQVINSFPDVYIINIGVVDATIREVPLWFYRLSSRNVDNLFTKIFKGLYRGPVSKGRRMLAMLKGNRSWISKRKFEKRYDRFVGTLLKETNAQIMTLPINVANDRIEKQLPGSRNNHLIFNDLIKKITAKHGQTYLDLNDLTSEEHYPDGVHFNVAGHRMVANKLISHINEKTN